MFCCAGMRTRALSLHQQGWSWTKIATELGCHRTTVMRLVHKWQQTGCIGDLPHRRRPRPPQQQTSLCGAQPLPAHNSALPKRPSLAPQVVVVAALQAPVAGREPPPSTSSSPRSTTITVRRRLKELRSQLGIQSPPSPKRPAPAEEAARQQPPPPPPRREKPPRTLEEVAGFSGEELGRLVFSDMKIFLCERGGGVRVWRLGQPPLHSCGALRDFFQGGGLSATFWVCVSGSGRKGQMLHIPNELTEERYVQILHNGLLPSAAAIYGLDAHRFLFAQDPSSIQASPGVEDFLRQQQVQCAEWPADLNPCDLLWPEVEAHCDSTPSTVAELVTTVRHAYDNVDPAYIQWLVAPVRIRSLCTRMLRGAGRQALTTPPQALTTSPIPAMARCPLDLESFCLRVTSCLEVQ
ncbi:transposable element Tcb1 transposase [Caerostris extrusa]|uniref:Transposable element Tcb1 transposase n=1 Tax=Caerostris extrusa TaxID=172846 RepID=A0AAV4SLN9_CAEEX|nr:transposable element Tcb1 transposase [Caerostris extrusa]